MTAKFNEILTWGSDNPYSYGFITGVLCFVAIGFCYWLIKALLFRRPGRCRVVTMVSANGEELCISENAVQEFVTRVVAELGEAVLNSFSMSENRSDLILRVKLDVLPETNIPYLRDRLSQQIKSGTSEKLGIDRNILLKLIVHSVSAEEKKVARASRRVTGNASRVEEAPHRTPLEPLPYEHEEQ